MSSGVIVFGGLVLISLITVFFFGWSLVTLGITVVYPAVQSIKAIESHDTQDDKDWLTYWIIFGLLTLADDLFGWLLAFIPYYSTLKIVFFLYLFVPYFKGAHKIYELVVQPFLKTYRPVIEQLINDVQGAAKEAAREAKDEVLKKAQDPTILIKGAQLAA